MPWQDRLRPAAYVSPSGTRIALQYEDVSKSLIKLTSSFDFPDANGTYVQDLGRAGRRFPFRVFFWGDDYDVTANEFETALLERGIGKLEHPIYGTIDVVPFGEISRRDDLKTAANQAIFEIQFFETVRVLFPNSELEPGQEVIQSVSDFNNASAKQFSEKVTIQSALQRLQLASTFRRVLNTTRNTMQRIAAPRNEILREVNSIFESVNRTLAVVANADDLFTLSSQTIVGIQVPASIDGQPERALAIYGEAIAGTVANDYSVDGTSKPANDFRTDDLYGSTFLTGAALALVNSTFTTKAQAISAADSLLSLFDDLNTWQEINYAALEILDTGETYQQLQDIAYLTAGFLVQISFTLRQEKILFLDRNRNIIELVAELYGAVDSELDFFIESNSLTGDEILELPKGRRVVYYI